MSVNKNNLKIKRKIRSLRFKNKIDTFNKVIISVFRSNKNLSALIKNGNLNKVVFSYSTFQLDKKNNKTKTEKSLLLAEKLSEYIKNNKIENLVFDRSGYLYHGRIKAFLEKLRELNVKI